MNSYREHQSGLAIVEFTVVSSALLLMLFGIISFGYYMFSLQMVNEITRKAARLASVCYVTDSADINTLVIDSNAPSDFTTSHLVIEYLDESGGVVTGDLEDEDTFTSIRFVRAKVENYDYQFISLFNYLGNNGLVSVPSFETTLPAESLGVVRPNKNNTNGTKTDC